VFSSYNWRNLCAAVAGAVRLVCGAVRGGEVEVCDEGWDRKWPPQHWTQVCTCLNDVLPAPRRPQWLANYLSLVARPGSHHIFPSTHWRRCSWDVVLRRGGEMMRAGGQVGGRGLIGNTSPTIPKVILHARTHARTKVSAKWC